MPDGRGHIRDTEKIIKKREQEMKGKIRYQRELQKTYMIAEECEKELMENYAGRMVLQGKVRGLAVCQKQLIDGVWEIWYDISSLQTLEQIFAVKEIVYKELKYFIEQLLNILEEMERCLIDSGQLCLEPGFLFMDMEKSQVRFLFDYTEKREKNGICELAEYLLERTCHKDEQAVSLVYYFYEQVQKENFSIKEMELYLHKGDEASKCGISEKEHTVSETDFASPEPWKTEPPKAPSEPWDDILEVLPGKEAKLPEKQPEKQRKWHQMNWNSRGGVLLEGGLACIITVLLLGIGLFIVQRYFVLEKMELQIWIGGSAVLFLTGIGLAVFGLSKERSGKREESPALESRREDAFEERDFYRSLLEEQQENTDGRTIYVGNALLNREYCLIEKKRGEERRHKIPSYPYIIGKEKDRVNLVLGDHSVSRIHARLVEEDGNVYVEDLHSTNGTYLNDFPLTPHERVKLKRGDLLQLGKVELDFQ